tara:strand:- start:3323 stop:3562 length:240 start_codon:yes stop_codon:yes gene_type:complete
MDNIKPLEETAVEDVAPQSTRKPPEDSGLVDVTLVLRRDFKLGTRDRVAGEVVARLKLDADVTLAFLGDSLTHGFIGLQ